MTLRLRQLILLTSVVFCPAVARAGGALLNDLDAVAIGQGTAFIAAPTTGSAFWYNPASLANQGGGLRIQLEGGFQYSPLSFQRDENGGVGYDLVRNKDTFKPAAMLAITYDFGVPGLAIGVGVYTPIATNYAFSDDGPQRYQAISASYHVINVHLAVAYQVFNWLSLGVTFGNTYFASTQRVAVSGALAGLSSDPEDPNFSVPFTVDIVDPFTITSNFGVRVDPLKQLSLGLSLTPPYDVNGAGKFSAALPENLAPLVQIQGDKVKLSGHLPLFFRAGVRYRPIDKLAVEAAFVWEQWARNKAVDLSFDDVRVAVPPLNLNTPLPVVSLLKNNIDTYSARFGVEYSPLAFLVLRVGGFYESPSTKTAYFDILQPDTHKWNASVGFSLTFWKMAFDAGYSHTFAAPVHVTNSGLSVTGVLPGRSGAPTVIGNGTYNFSWDIVHFGVRLALFEPKPAPPLPPPSNSVSVVRASESLPTTMPSP